MEVWLCQGRKGMAVFGFSNKYGSVGKILGNICWTLFIGTTVLL
jgi:hypothetical protein